MCLHVLFEFVHPSGHKVARVVTAQSTIFMLLLSLREQVSDGDRGDTLTILL